MERRPAREPARDAVELVNRSANLRESLDEAAAVCRDCDAQGQWGATEGFHISGPTLPDLLGLLRSLSHNRSPKKTANCRANGSAQAGFETATCGLEVADLQGFLAPYGDLSSSELL
jgi:hypothetical protein